MKDLTVEQLEHRLENAVITRIRAEALFENTRELAEIRESYLYICQDNEQVLREIIRLRKKTGPER